MNEQRIKALIMSGNLRKTFPDIKKANALTSSSLEIAESLKAVPLTEKTARLLLKELYDAFRQLGDAKWHIMGYKSEGHEASIELLQYAEIKSSFKLQNFDRFRRIRNEATYDGKSVTLEQAKDIIILWNDVHKELIEWVKK